MSVRKLCSDNNVSNDFFPNQFYVKELVKGTTLLARGVGDGLYKLLSTTRVQITEHKTQTYIMNKGTADGAFWHDSLGHTYQEVLELIVRGIDLSIIKNSF